MTEYIARLLGRDSLIKVYATFRDALKRGHPLFSNEEELDNELKYYLHCLDKNKLNRFSNL